MNERIRELAEQQGLTGPNYFISSQELDQFARLIIEECVEAVKNSIWHLPRGYKVSDQAEFVKKHFGVEQK